MTEIEKGERNRDSVMVENCFPDSFIILDKECTGHTVKQQKVSYMQISRDAFLNVSFSKISALNCKERFQ